MLQYVAACCSVLQMCCSVQPKYGVVAGNVCCSVLQCVAVCCSVLQCVAVCCSVLQCVAVCYGERAAACCSVLQCAALCCGALHCVAGCCRVQTVPGNTNTEVAKDMLRMGWLRLVGSLKLQVSFAKYHLFYRALLQKRRIILRNLLTVATP